MTSRVRAIIRVLMLNNYCVVLVLLLKCYICSLIWPSSRGFIYTHAYLVRSGECTLINSYVWMIEYRYRIADRKLWDIYIVRNNILMMNMWSVESFEVLMKYSHPPHVPGYGYCWDEGRAVPALGTQNIMFHSKCGLEASCVTPRLNISAGHWGTEIQNISLSSTIFTKDTKTLRTNL